MNKQKITLLQNITLMLSVTLLLLFNVSYLQASNLIDAQANLVSAQEVDLELVNEKEFKALPNEYRLLNEKQGTIETLVYNVANRRGGTDVKRLHVYLPHGYYDEKMTRSIMFYI